MAAILIGAGAAIAAFVASLLPVLVWLAFWIFEEGKHPEPRKVIMTAFIAGMAAVAVTLPLEYFAANLIPMGFGLVLVWAATEEILKFGFAWATVLRWPLTDRPIDSPVNLITVALGFSAIENTLFLFTPIARGEFFSFLATGDLRFIGATLIHVLSSAIIGAALAFAFYRSRKVKIAFGMLGVILAIALHAFFNSLILATGEASLLTVFLGVWVGIVFVLLALEGIKGIRRPEWWEKVFVKEQ